MKRFCSNPSHTNKPAAIYCKRCEKYFCAECETMFHSTYFADHTPYVTRDLDEEIFTDKCEEHTNYPLDFYCRDHICLCCSLCKDRNGMHNNCSVVPLTDIRGEEVQQRLTKATTNIREKLERLNGFSLEGLKRKVEEFSCKANEAKEAIRRTFQELRKAIDARESEPMQEIEKAYDRDTTTNAVSILSNTEDFREILDRAKVMEEKEAWDVPKQKELFLKVCDVIKASIRLDTAVAEALDSMEYDKSLLYPFPVTWPLQ